MTRSILYFGSNEALLQTVPGNFVPYSHTKAIVQEIDPPNRMISKEGLIVPAIPARDIALENHDSVESYKSSEESLFESQELILSLQTPLMKHEHGSIVAYQSGIRSAILPLDGKYIRLKGCGNNYEGFPIRTVAEQDKTFEVRGCTFTFTSLRELYFTTIINKLLSAQGWIGGNKSIGYFKYNLECQFPFVDRCCCIFQTFGEKRLGDHLLRGLEQLLPFLVSDFEEKQVFPEERFDNNEIISTDMMLICEGEYGKAVNLKGSNHLKESTTKLKELKLVHAFSLQQWNKRLQKIEEGIQWIQQCKEGPGSLLAYVYFALGRQVATIYEILEMNRIIWGTYHDLLAAMHCNAHPNNFVVLPPEFSQNNQWIAPVDFDMAFDYDSFIGSEEKFSHYYRTEKFGLKIALCGMNINSGAKGVDLQSSSKAVIIALRDTLLSSFESNEKVHYHKELVPAVQSLFQIALALTNNDVS